MDFNPSGREPGKIATQHINKRRNTSVSDGNRQTDRPETAIHAKINDTDAGGKAIHRKIYNPVPIAQRPINKQIYYIYTPLCTYYISLIIKAMFSIK